MPSDSKVANASVGGEGGAVIETGLTPPAEGINILVYVMHPDLGYIQDTYPGMPGLGM